MDAIQAGAMKIRIDYKLKAAVKFDDAAGVHVAWCPMLDIFSQGTDEAEATRALTSALSMYLKHCYRRGILESVLQGRGFDVSDEPSVKSEETGDSGEYISVRPDADLAREATRDFGSLFSIDVPLELIMQSKQLGGSAACLS
jgi:hypothetical protein